MVVDTSVNLVSLDASVNPYASDAVGMPNGDPAPAAPAVVDMQDPDTSAPPSGFLASLENFGSSAVSKVESGVETVYGAGKTVVGDVVGGAENVVSKTVGVATGAVSSVTFNLVLILAVVGIALVFVARSGAIKANVSR